MTVFTPQTPIRPVLARRRWLLLALWSLGLAAGSALAAAPAPIPGSSPAAESRNAAVAVEAAIPYIIPSGPTARPPLRQRWSYRLEAPVVAFWLPPQKLYNIDDPAKALRYLYVYDAGNTLTAFHFDDDPALALAGSGARNQAHARNGTPAWSVNLGGTVVGQPAFTELGMYFVVSGNRLVGLDPRSGDTFWRIRLPFAPASGPVVREGGADYSADDKEVLNDEARALRAANQGRRGDNLHVLLPGLDQGIYAVGIDSRIMEITDGPPVRHTVQIPNSDAHILWRHPTSSPVIGPVVESRDAVYYTERSGIVRGIRRDRGRQDMFGYDRTQVPVVCPPALAGDRLLQSCTDGSLYAFFTADMRPSWRCQLGGKLLETPLIFSDATGGDLAAVKVENGPLRALSANRGFRVWRWDDGRALVGRLYDYEADESRRDLLIVLANGADGRPSTLAAYAARPATSGGNANAERVDQQRWTLLREIADEAESAAAGGMNRMLRALLGWDSYNEREQIDAVRKTRNLLQEAGETSHERQNPWLQPLLESLQRQFASLARDWDALGEQQRRDIVQKARNELILCREAAQPLRNWDELDDPQRLSALEKARDRFDEAAGQAEGPIRMPLSTLKNHADTLIGSWTTMENRRRAETVQSIRSELEAVNRVFRLLSPAVGAWDTRGQLERWQMLQEVADALDQDWDLRNHASIQRRMQTLLGGRPLWRLDLSSPVDSYAAQARYRMVFLGRDRQIYALELRR